MVACRFPVLALLSLAWQATGAIFRHSTVTSHAKGSVAATVARRSVANSVSNAEEVRRVAGLMDVEKDLETDKKKDDTNLRDLESQIVALVRKRDAAKRDEARKDREILFLQNQIGRAESSVSTEASAQVAQESQQEVTAGKGQADLNVDAAIASADQVVEQAEAADTVGQRSEEKAQADTSAQAAEEAELQRRAQEEAAAREAAAAAAQRAEAEKKRKAEAAAAAAAAAEQQESRAQFEARIRAEAEEKARIKIQAEQEAESRLRAEAEAKAKAKLDAEEAAKKKAEQERQSAEQKKREEEEKKKNELADHADDSFKDFMKEEDGEDQQNDPDYEDSANALAGAIGWDRGKIEKNADSAVKQLTEAIGGKKVVQSLQGMMAGVGR